MSWVGDALKFEKFNLKDMWGKIKDNPERAFIGAIDPWSSKMWGKVLGKDYEPIVDQMGGAYGGHTFSAFGNKDGGVYKRAQDAGIDTGPGGTMHDAAHVIAGAYAGAYGADALGGAGAGSGSGGTGGGWQQWMQMAPQGGGDSGASQKADIAEKIRQKQEEEDQRRKLAAQLLLRNQSNPQ